MVLSTMVSATAAASERGDLVTRTRTVARLVVAVVLVAAAAATTVVPAATATTVTVRAACAKCDDRHPSESLRAALALSLGASRARRRAESARAGPRRPTLSRATRPMPANDPLTLLRFYNSRDRDPVAAVGMWRETTEWRERFGVALQTTHQPNNS